jgi:hypothetical protein
MYQSSNNNNTRYDRQSPAPHHEFNVRHYDDGRALRNHPAESRSPPRFDRRARSPSHYDHGRSDRPRSRSRSRDRQPERRYHESYRQPQSRAAEPSRWFRPSDHEREQMNERSNPRSSPFGRDCDNAERGSNLASVAPENRSDREHRSSRTSEKRTAPIENSRGEKESHPIDICARPSFANFIRGLASSGAFIPVDPVNYDYFPVSFLSMFCFRSLISFSLALYFSATNRRKYGQVTFVFDPGRPCYCHIAQFAFHPAKLGVFFLLQKSRIVLRMRKRPSGHFGTTAT